MRLKGRQHRFVAGTLGSWIALRAVLLWTGVAAVGVSVVAPRKRPIAEPGASWPVAAAGVVALGPPFAPARAGRPATAPPAPAPPAVAAPPEREVQAAWRATDSAPALPSRFLRLALAQFLPGSPQAALRHARFEETDRPATGDEAPLTSAVLARPVATTAVPARWSGEAYLFVRPGSGTNSLAAGGGELGGGQAAARLAFQLNRDGPVRTAVAARVYAPLASRGAEAAIGLDWHPFPAVPLRLSVERRADLDGRGRNAWSAYAAGGFYLERLGGRVALDGYAQAGVVGTERRDLFVDGALRAGRRWRLGPAVVTAGAGLWGAAQPAVSRLDVGPRVAVALPVEAHLVSLAVEGRLRVAGNAHPGSGAAMTLALAL